MIYIECPECGQKALAVATRCPRCGYNYPQRPIWKRASRSELERLRPLLPIAGVLVAGVTLVVAIARFASPGPASGPLAMAPVEAAPPVRAPPIPAPSPTSPAAADNPIAAAPPTPAPSRPAGRGARRYARTWVNVREARGQGAAAVRVLKPGEAVMVDSLRRGWYRVLADDHPLGYVHRSNLDAVPPPTRP